MIGTLDTVDSQGQVDIQLNKSHPEMTETSVIPTFWRVKYSFLFPCPKYTFSNHNVRQNRLIYLYQYIL
jgi:hypothetical protein